MIFDASRRKPSGSACDCCGDFVRDGDKCDAQKIAARESSGERFNIRTGKWEK